MKWLQRIRDGLRSRRLPFVVSAGAAALFLVAASATPGWPQEDLWADIHAHPSRFHRANVPRIGDDEIDLYRRAGVDVVVCNVSTDTPYRGGYVLLDGTRVPTGQRRPEPGEPWTYTLDRLGRILKTIEEGAAVLARNPGDVASAQQRGKLALIPALEGADALEGRIERLGELHGLGVGLVQIVHFRANAIGHIQTWPYTPGGLTEFGRQVIREANRLGIVIDLAHANSQTLRDVLALSRHPVLFSHTGVTALRDADRHLGDEDIKAIAAHRGIIGIWPNGSTVPHVKDMVAHIEHVKRLVGVDHIAIGSDLRGMSSYSEGFGEGAHFGAIEQALSAAGHDAADIAKIMGGNFMRVFNEVTR